MNQHKYKVGDKIKIIFSELPEDSEHFGEDNSYMDKYYGKETTIKSLKGFNYDGTPCYETEILLNQEDLDSGIGSEEDNRVFVNELEIQLIS